MSRPTIALRMVLSGIGLACTILDGGCVHAPRQATAPASAPAQSSPGIAGGDGTPTVSVDLNRTVGDNTVFHESATERQKFQVHVDFGKLFEAQGNPDAALQEYRDALKVAEGRKRGDLTAADEALAHRRIASTLDRQGQFHQSEPHYQKAQKLAPKDAKVWNDTGYSYYLQGRWDAAERAFRTALRFAPDDARARTNLGMTLAAAGKSEAALPLLGANQGVAIGHANLGYLLASTGQYARARQEYEAALAMRSDLTLARRALAQLDRQERGISPPPAGSIAHTIAAPPPSAPVAHNATPPLGDRTLDAAVLPTSAPKPVETRPGPPTGPSGHRIPPPKPASSMASSGVVVRGSGPLDPGPARMPASKPIEIPPPVPLLEPTNAANR